MSDDRLERIEDKLDAVAERINKIDITLAGQHVSLVDHIRRTALLEKAIVPIKKHVDAMQGAAKLIMIASAIVATIEVIIRLIK